MRLLLISSLIKSVSFHNSPGLRMSHHGVSRTISSSQGCHMAHEMGTSFTSVWVSPAPATEEAIVFILSCRTLLCPYENSVSDSEFCIFFFLWCRIKWKDKQRCYWRPRRWQERNKGPGKSCGRSADVRGERGVSESLPNLKAAVGQERAGAEKQGILFVRF